MTSLNNLKKIIEDLPKIHHIEILNILKKYKTIYINENNNGTFINLSELDNNIIQELENYVEYVLKQQKHLSIVEKEKQILEETFFNNNNNNNNNNIIASKDNKGYTS